ncbi:MAG: hypothetical protein ACI9T8_000319 [Candidatus Saccharimonadales bacterium]|jgi:hypothetical protein
MHIAHQRLVEVTHEAHNHNFDRHREEILWLLIVLNMEQEPVHLSGISTVPHSSGALAVADSTFQIRRGFIYDHSEDEHGTEHIWLSEANPLEFYGGVLRLDTLLAHTESDYLIQQRSVAKG